MNGRPEPMAADKTPPRLKSGQSWRLADLIDYELLLAHPDSANLGAGALPMGALRDDTVKTRRQWLRVWLDAARKKEYGEEPSPGALCASARSFITVCCVLAGAALGLVVLGGLLAGFGGEMPGGAPRPVNVLWVFMVGLLPQLVLLAIALCTVVAAVVRPSYSPPLFLRFLASGILVPLLGRVAAALVRQSGHAGKSEVARLRAAAGLMLGRGRLHGGALAWPLLIWLQWAALAYSAAMALGMFAVILFHEQPAGWGTSFPGIVTGERVAEVVRNVAFPWREIWGAGVGYPDPQQVFGTRIQSGMLTIDANDGDRYAWWPFLLLSLVSYVLLPRIGLLALALYGQRSSLRREGFQDVRSDRLFRSLVRRDLGLDAGSAPAGSSPTTPVAPGRLISPERDRGMARHAALAVLDEELDSAETRRVLAARVDDVLGWEITDYFPAYRASEQSRFIEALQEHKAESKVPRVLIIKRDIAPTVASLRGFVRRVLDVLGPDGHLVFAIGGRVDLCRDLPDADLLGVWQEMADQLKMLSPNIDVIRIANPVAQQ